MKFFMVESFSERKGLLSQMPARKGQVLGRMGQTASSRADGEGDVATILESLGAFIRDVSGCRRVGRSERIYTGYRQGGRKQCNWASPRRGAWSVRGSTYRNT